MRTQHVQDDLSDQDRLENTNDDLKNQVINVILFMYAGLGFPVICTRLFFFPVVDKPGWALHVLVTISAWLALAGSVLFRKKMSYRIKVRLFLSILLMLGIYCLFIWRIATGGGLCLILLPLFITLFFDAKKGFYALAVSIGLMCMAGFLVAVNSLSFDPSVTVLIPGFSGDIIITTAVAMLTVAALIYSQGKFSHLVNDSIDTDIQLSEKKLLQEKYYSETVINSLPGIFFMCDEERHLIRWNRNLELTSGYSAGELQRMKVQDWVDETAKDYVDYKFQEGLVDGTLRLELNVRTKTDETIPFYLSGRTLYIENRTYLLGIGYNMTDRKAAELSLATSEKRFRELIETISVGICILKENSVVYMNPKQVKIFGKYPESFEIKDLPFHPDDIVRILGSYESIVAGATQAFEHEVRLFQFRIKTGRKRLRFVYCNGSRISYMDEMAVLLTMVDITKTRELEQLVQLREKMVSLGHVAAGIAHEIRNPLSGINILVDGIGEDFQDPSNAETIKKDILEIQKASNKISAVIKRVLDFSRPGRPSLKPTDINTAVTEAVELSRVTLKKEKVTIESRLAENLPRIHMDGQAMEQVFLNLINNAANAMTAAEGEKKVEILSWSEEDEVFLSVSDSGSGIPDDLKEKVFEPFFTTRSDGSGIGLSLCQRIITDHGGTIRANASDLGGAEFKIKFPIAKG